MSALLSRRTWLRRTLTRWFSPLGTPKRRQRPSFRPRVEGLEERWCPATEYWKPYAAGQNLYWTYVKQGGQDAGATNWVNANGSRYYGANGYPGATDTGIFDGNESRDPCTIDAGTNPLITGALITKNNYYGTGLGGTGILKIVAGESFVVKNAADSKLEDGTHFNMGSTTSKVYFEGTTTVGDLTITGSGSPPAEGTFYWVGNITYNPSQATYTQSDWVITTKGNGTDTGTGQFDYTGTPTVLFSGTNTHLLTVRDSGKLNVKTANSTSLFDSSTRGVRADIYVTANGEVHDDTNANTTTILCGGVAGTGDQHMGLYNSGGLVVVGNGNVMKVQGNGENAFNYYQDAGTLRLVASGATNITTLDCTVIGAKIAGGTIDVQTTGNGATRSKASISTAANGCSLERSYHHARRERYELR